MLTCPQCGSGIADGERRCAGCGRSLADVPVWRLAFKSEQGLRKHYDQHMVHHGLVVRRGEPSERDEVVRLRIILPEERGEVWLAGRVVGTVEQPESSKAPFAVQLELLDLDREKQEQLRPVARSRPAASAERRGAAATAAVAPAARGSAPQAGASDRAEPGVPAPRPDALDGFVAGLLARRDQPLPVDAPEAAAAAPELRKPETIRERLPEELAQELTDFTLHFVRAVTKASYYTADHQEAGKAKLGIYDAFRALVSDHPEVTFYARKAGERWSILVYGIFGEPTDLAQALLRGTSELYVPKLAHYFESNGLVSISFKPALSEDEFHQFIDLLASPSSLAPGSTETIVHRLARNRIHNISVVVAEDRISGQGLSWRVEMALTRLRKDLSVIPLYEHLNETELRRVRLQVFRDVVRPIREVNLIRELLENCDRIVEEVEEFCEEQLVEIEAQVLHCVPEKSLPALLEGLVRDVAEAKRSSAKQTDRLLRLTRRVATMLVPEQARKLEDAFRTLVDKQVLELVELPASLQRKFRIERDAAAFSKQQEQILARLDRETNVAAYQALLDFLASIFSELLSRADPAATLAILDHVSEHRIAEPPFARRPELAATWLEAVIYSSLAEDLVRELSRADKLKRNTLLELCRRLGDETAPILFRALAGCDNANTRQAITEVLADLKYASRAFLRREIQQPDLPTDYLLELLRLLGHIGGAGSQQLLAPALGHPDAVVRIHALGVAAVGEAAENEEPIVAALEDSDAKVRETALKALFERGSTTPQLFSCCARLLAESEDSDDELARLVCSRLASYASGRGREPSVALLRSVLGEAPETRTGWWSSLKRSVKREESQRIGVKIAACQALGRLGACEASDTLERLCHHPSPALRRAAEHALLCIRGEATAP